METLGKELFPSLMVGIALQRTCLKDGMRFLSVAPHEDVGGQYDCLDGLGDENKECNEGDLHLP